MQDVCVLFAQQLFSKLQDIFIQRLSTTVTPEQVAGLARNRWPFEHNTRQKPAKEDINHNQGNRVLLMGANGNGNGGYDDKVWDQIKSEWLAGQLSISDISRNYGPSRTAIRKKAKAYGWPARAALADEVRKEIRSRLLTDDEVPGGVPPSEASEIVESAAKRGVAIVRRQRNLLTELLDIVGATLEELRGMQVISRETLEKKHTKHQAALIAALSKARLAGMRAVSQVLNQAIPLERLTYSLDDDKGGAVAIKYVAPDYKKPPYSGLSEDQWG